MILKKFYYWAQHDTYRENTKEKKSIFRNVRLVSILPSDQPPNYLRNPANLKPQLFDAKHRKDLTQLIVQLNLENFQLQN
jgi:hypothetical protein